MAIFLGTFENKIDRKGRVSVPARFRAHLAEQSFQGIVAYPSHKHAAIEGVGYDRMEKLAASLDQFDQFSDEQDELATSLFADACELPFDGDGRIMLPPSLIEHASLKEKALFVGAGPMFRIWSPETFAQFREQARASAKTKNRTLPIRSGDDA